MAGDLGVVPRGGGSWTLAPGWWLRGGGLGGWMGHLLFRCQWIVGGGEEGKQAEDAGGQRAEDGGSGDRVEDGGGERAEEGGGGHGGWRCRGSSGA